MFTNINQQEYLKMIEQDDVIAIDVRSRAEYEEFRFPKSEVGFDWNSGEFHDRMHEIDPDKKIIMLCRSGARSAQACLLLSSNGYQNLYNLEGGANAWVK